MNVLHVLNGDATRIPLEASATPGDFTVWLDTLHEGPVPAGLTDEELRDLRVRYVADRFGMDETEVSNMARRWDASLARWADYDEVVFWFEHDLFDQLILIRHLAWIGTLSAPKGRFSLICIGEHPEVPDFHGLGELSSEQLFRLFPSRQPISAGEIEAGEQAWRHFRAADPSGLADWLSAPAGGILPFLPGALRRHLEELPGTADGLSRSERQILRAIDEGAATFAEIFHGTQKMEERVYMGDASLAAILRDLSRARVPLVREVDGRYALTPSGRDVLAGRADHVALNGIDRWLGGVHLTPLNCFRQEDVLE